MLPIGGLLGISASRAAWAATPPFWSAGGIVYVALMSFVVAAVCGYMAGLIGASNSPLSGIGILVVVGAGLLLVMGINPRCRSRPRPRWSPMHCW